MANAVQNLVSKAQSYCPEFLHLVKMDRESLQEFQSSVWDNDDLTEYRKKELMDDAMHLFRSLSQDEYFSITIEEYEDTVVEVRMQLDELRTQAESLRNQMAVFQRLIRLHRLLECPPSWYAY